MRRSEYRDCNVTKQEHVLDDIASCYHDKNNIYETKECKQKAENAGLQHLGRGSKREVFQLDSYNFGAKGACVVKFDTDHGEYSSNHREVAAWNAVEGTHAADSLAEVSDHGDDYGWVSMAKADKSREITREELDSVHFDIGSELDCSDKHFANLGVVDGEVKKIDYDDCMPRDQL